MMLIDLLCIMDYTGYYLFSDCLYDKILCKQLVAGESFNEEGDNLKVIDII